jgi:DNA gyrase subunit A
MSPQRPDLTLLAAPVRQYIEFLESEIERLKLASGPRRASRPAAPAAEEDPIEALPEINEPAELPTTIQIITATAGGLGKRTLRHLYNRQRRAGHGLLDTETPDDQPPTILSMADEGQTLLLLTQSGRAWRMPLAMMAEGPFRAAAAPFTAKLNLPENERITAIVPEQAEGYLTMISRTGYVRTLRHHVFGDYMKAGAEMYKASQYGALAAACWTPGNGDLLIVTRQGKAIRFSEKLIPPAGGPGIRLTNGDEAVGLAPVNDDSLVFLISADGRGTLRQMGTFTPNKAPNAGGKIIISSDEVVAALSADNKKDAFVLSKQGKVIRFSLSDIPPKDGVVQGVVLMSLRADEPVAAVLA